MVLQIIVHVLRLQVLTQLWLLQHEAGVQLPHLVHKLLILLVRLHHLVELLYHKLQIGELLSMGEFEGGFRLPEGDVDHLLNDVESVFE